MLIKTSKLLFLYLEYLENTDINSRGSIKFNNKITK